MKHYKNLTIDQTSVGSVVFRAAQMIAPGCLTPAGNLLVEAQSGDAGKSAQIALLRSLLLTMGIPRSKRGDKGTFGYEVVREYEESDLRECELLRVMQQDSVLVDEAFDYRWNGQEQLAIKAHDVRHFFRLGSFERNWIVVSNDTRQILEQGKFIGLKFRDVILRGKQVDFIDPPLWLLESLIVMPKLANVHQLIHGGGPPPVTFSGDYSKVVYIEEPPYRTGEMHYRRSEITALGKFDVALAFEKLAIRSFVVSQRFYQHCLKHKIPLAVEPVRIDPD